MTHTQHLATIEQIMNGNNPFEIIDTPLGVMERWRAEAMLIGTTGGIKSVYDSIRADAAAQEARANADKAQHALLRRFFTTVGKFLDATDHMVSRVEAAEEKRRTDEEQQLQFEEEPLTLPPDIAEYQTLAPATKIEDETHHPGGELHSIDPKEEEQPSSSELPEPPLETESDAGGVPLSCPPVPLSYTKTRRR